VEASVFETGRPPEFRLYFYDTQEQAMLAVPYAATAETIRPGGKRQVFEFVLEGDYLRSTTDIPEPHEFTLRLALTRQGERREYETRFTEDHGHGHDHGGHGHDHGHAHRHDHRHGHDDREHATGILGWLKGTFGHSHSAAEKTDSAMESNERGIWALKVSLVGLGLTAVFQLVIVLLSGSVGLLADTIHNFADAGTSLPLWVAFALARRGPSRRFTYGYGKVEDVAGVLIVLIIFFSACVAAWESLLKIIHAQPVHNLGWVALAAVVGFLGNEAVAVFRIKVGREIGSAALVADGQHARVDGFTSLAVLIGVLGVYFGVPILDPIVGLLITVAILFIVKDAATSVWMRLIDGIEPDILTQIEHAPTHVEGVKRVRDVRARWLGHRVHGDLTIDVDPGMCVKDAHALAGHVERALLDHVRLLDGVVVRVVPAAEE
jgi:cation diffusion facilitator family transporter